MKNNKKLMWVLGVLVLGVWGMIAQQIMSAVTTDEMDDIIAENVVGNYNRDNSLKFNYDDGLRDPFRFVSGLGLTNRHQTRKENQRKFVDEWKPPPIRLSGILVDREKSTAVLETHNGETRFLKEGDSLNGMKVLKISASLMQYSFNKQKSSLTLSK